MITIILQVSNYKESLKNRNFQQIHGLPVISYLIRRIKSDSEFNLILATSDRQEDDILEEIANTENTDLYRGVYDDVLGRLCEAANKYKVENFVRVFANYPLLDLGQLKDLYAEHICGQYEYSYNEHQKGVLWGTGCEVFQTSFLNELNKKELQESQRETVSFFIRQNSHKYKVHKRDICVERPGYKVCLETKKDFEVILELVDHLETIDNHTLITYFDSHRILAAHNMEEPAKEVGLEKLFLHPRKIESLLYAEDKDFEYPISVELTLTNRCNLRCVYCSDNDLRGRQGIRQELSSETLRALFMDLSSGGTQGVVIEGGGEPTLYKDFKEIVLCAKENHLAVGLITNGTVCLESELLKEFEWIRVSLDASTASEYVELKGVDCFEKVITNLAYYAEHTNTLGVGYVVTNKNISEIESLVMRLREVGVSYIQLRPVVDCERLYPKDINLSFLKVYQSRDFGVLIDGMKENAQSGNHSLPCKAHSLTSIISGDGSVYLCGRLNVYNWLKPIGNINKQSFHDIWCGEERMLQMDMVNDAEFCERYCPQCRISKFNELLERLALLNSRHFI